MPIKILFYTLALCLLITACDKEKEEPDTYTPVITFIEPADGETINSGDELHMEVDFNYTGNTIHEVGLWLINANTADTVLDYAFTANAEDFYTIHQHYVTDVGDTTEYMIVAYSANEDGTQMVSDHVHVTVNP